MRKSLALCLLCFALRVFGGDIRPMLINGTPADPKDWPASVYASMGGSRCTATVVGERVLLIAAHCGEGGGKPSFSVGPNGYRSTSCSTPSQYPSNETAD